MTRKRKTIGIAGTAKNTGKTTATIALLNHFHAQGITLGLTSIGYDGETLDNVTGLPKPRIFAPKGLVVVTAEKCLEASSAKIAVKDKLDIPTPLGKLVGGVVEREGLLVTAGPNQIAHLRTVKHWLHENGAELTIVDGALNRISPMVETDGLILATGAAYKPVIRDIALHAHSLERICNHHTRVPEAVAKQIAGTTNTVMWGRDGQGLAESSGFLLNPAQLETFRTTAAEARLLYCPGVITPDCLKSLLEIPFQPGMKFVFSDPTKIIIGDNLLTADNYLERIIQQGGEVNYVQSLSLIAVTINPFYPNFRYEQSKYEPAFVDKQLLHKNVSSQLSVPVIDVVANGSEALAEAIIR